MSTSRRTFLKRTAVSGLAIAFAPRLLRAGDGSVPYIAAFPSRPSLNVGDVLVMHVSTEMPEFRVRFHRIGQAFAEPVHTTEWMPGRYAEPGQADTAFDWPAYELETSREWIGGAYVAIFETRDRNGVVYTPELRPYDKYAQMLIIFRDPKSHADILYKLATNTYHAYTFGKAETSKGELVGGNIFENVRPHYIDGIYAGNKVTILRPGGGTGGDFQDGGWAWGGNLVDPYKKDTRRGTFAHWDVAMIEWLEANRYAVDFCTDLDLHEDTAATLLTPAKYRVLLSVGHDAYWSQEMRDHATRFLYRGGNLAFFSGEAAAWRVRYDDRNTSFFVHNYDPLGAEDRWWNGQYVAENPLTGVGNRNAGRALEEIDPAGYHVDKAASWVFGATGVANGDTFGDADRLLSYYVDGARFEYDASGIAKIIRNDDGIPYDGTPLNFQILAHYETADSGGNPNMNWELTPREEAGAHPWGATMGLHTNVGRVFTAGTTDWSRLLGDRTVHQITRNVLDGFIGYSRVFRLFDFNLDRIPELILRNPITRETRWWVMDGILPSGGGCFDPLPWEWLPVAALPLTQTENATEVLMQHQESGEVMYWTMQGSTMLGEGRIDGPQAGGYSIVGAADGRVLLWDASKSSMKWWKMEGTKVSGEIELRTEEMQGWNFGGLFGADLLWQNADTGELSVWIMRDDTHVETATLRAAEKGWQAVGAGDFNDDGYTDILFQNVETNQLMVRWMYKEYQQLGEEILSSMP